MGYSFFDGAAEGILMGRNFALTREVNEAWTKYNEMVAEVQRLNGVVSKNIKEYNVLVRKYNAMKNEYNNLVDKYNTLKNKYNNLVDKYNHILNIGKKIQKRLETHEKIIYSNIEAGKTGSVKGLAYITEDIIQHLSKTFPEEADRAEELINYPLEINMISVELSKIVNQTMKEGLISEEEVRAALINARKSIEILLSDNLVNDAPPDDANDGASADVHENVAGNGVTTA